MLFSNFVVVWIAFSSYLVLNYNSFPEDEKVYFYYNNLTPFSLFLHLYQWTINNLLFHNTVHTEIVLLALGGENEIELDW